MGTRKRMLMCLVVLLSTAATYAQAPTAGTSNGERVAVINGVARYEDTNQPAARHRVQLIPVEAILNRSSALRIPTAMTDASGEFKFNNTAAGEYYVVARSADAHTSSSEASPFPLQTGNVDADAAALEQYKQQFPRITVSGQVPLEINLRVKNYHFGGISGRILNASGAPVPRAVVHSVKSGEPASGGSVIADENGTYHFRGLLAGEYVISAAPGNKQAGPDAPPNVQGTLGDTYFPSTTDRTMATPVVVSPDAEIGDVNITLAPLNLHRVGGTVRAGGDGHPIAGATLRFIKKGEDRDQRVEGAMGNYFSTTSADGRWNVSNLPDGVYTIDVRPASQIGGRGERFVNMKQELTVSGSDIEDLVIEVSSGVRVSGHVTVEQANTSTPTILIGIGGANTRVEANGDFTVSGVAEGEFPLSVTIRPQNAFYPKVVEVNGVDLLREKLQTTAGAEVKDVRIVLAPASVLAGRVLSAAGRTPLGQINVMLIPVDPANSPAFSRPNGATDIRGNFVIGGAPGEYFVVLWARGEPVPPHDVESITNGATKPTRVTLGPGEHKSVELLK